MTTIHTKHKRQIYKEAVEEFYTSYYSKLITSFSQRTKGYFTKRNQRLLVTISKIAPFAFFFMLFYVVFMLVWMISDRSALTFGNLLILTIFVITAIAYLTFWLKRKSPFFLFFRIILKQIIGKGYWKNFLYFLSKRGIAKFPKRDVEFRLQPDILIMVTPTETREIYLTSIKSWALGAKGVYLNRIINTGNEQPQIIVMDSKEKLEILADYFRKHGIKELP